MVVSRKKRCARCASGKATMDIMTGDKYLSIYPAFNHAIRAWKTWRKSAFRTTVADAQTVEDYKAFVIAQLEFTQALQAFQRSRKKHIGEEQTPRHDRGVAVAPGLGSGDASFQLRRIGNLLEARVEMEAFVSSRTASDALPMRRAHLQLVIANSFFRSTSKPTFSPTPRELLTP
jgi:hypothetical protein